MGIFGAWSVIKMAYIDKSKTDDWATPKKLYQYLNRVYHFDFDPCPLNATFDGLTINWGKSNFVNPPYSMNTEFIKKAYSEYLKGNLVVLLIPSRTDTRYFHEYCMKASEIILIKGRLRFNDTNPAPFASLLVIFDPTAKHNTPILKALDQTELEGIIQSKFELCEAIV